VQPPENLGRDGHEKTGGFIPDLGLPRRMWAGGKLQFHAPLFTGQPATKTTTIEAITQKTGRTGPLAFVTLRHDIHQSGSLCVTEHQDLVYRRNTGPTAPKSTPPTARTDEIHQETHSLSSTELFRYSALTMNGHRIHYDENYACDVEGYSGLVTHGPLLAQYLMLMAERQLGPLKSFQFRATAPLMHTENATFCINGNALWVRAPDGRQCMQATAS
jgi:3-methylfumaryl-CoA hydratase